jgi:DNA-binding IclR family transcriptional regulator
MPAARRADTATKEEMLPQSPDDQQPESGAAPLKAGRKTAASGDRDDVSGAQCIHRSLQIMRLLAGSPPQGLKLIDIAASLDLSHPTVYRILKALEREGVVERADGSRRYTVGLEMVWLGLGAARRFTIAAAAQNQLSRAVEEVGDTILLNVRSGVYSVCVERRNGGYPVKVTSAVVGSRLPLGASPAGRTMLAFLPEKQCSSIITANAQQLKAHDCSPEAIAEEIDYARARGYLCSEGLTVSNTRALIVPVFDAGGRPVAALSAISTRSRFPNSRFQNVVRTLNTCAKAISGELLQSAVERGRGANMFAD